MSRTSQAARLLGQASVAAFAASLLSAGSISHAHAADPETAARIEALERAIRQQQEQIAQQAAQIRDLKAGSAAQVAEVRRTVAEQPKIEFRNGRPTFASADGKFSVALRSTVQFDYANYLQQDGGVFADDPRRGSVGDAAESVRARDLGSGTNFRRAQFGIEGKLFGDFDYAAIYEFGGAGTEDQGRLTQGWVGYSGFKPFLIRAGALTPPSGLDDSFSSPNTLFLERATPAELARAVAGGDGRSSVGAQGYGDRWFGSLYFTGSSVATAAGFDEQTALLGRATFVPWKDADTLVHLGVNGSYVFGVQQGDPNNNPATTARQPFRFRDRPEIRVDATRLIDTGNINADHVGVVGVELAGTWKSTYVGGEYFRYSIDRSNLGAADLSSPHFQGFYVQAAQLLTGETRAYSPNTGGFAGIRPNAPFALDGSGWGAFEIAGRYSYTDLNYNEGEPDTALPTDGVRGGRQKAWTVGLNWYPTSAVRVLLDYQNISVDRLSPGGTAFTSAASGSSLAITTPAAGTQIGQDLEVIALRTQFAF